MNDNKEYINKFIKRQRIVSIISIVFILLSSTISAMAVSAYLYNSNEVSYNNNASGITSNNVQGAIDELYGHVTDYTSMDTRVSALENRWGTGTHSVDSNWLTIKNNGTADRGIIIKDASNVNRATFRYDPDISTTRLVGHDSSGTAGQGGLKIVGKPITIDATSGGAGNINLNGNVKVNGENLAISSTTSNGTLGNITLYKIGRIVICCIPTISNIGTFSAWENKTIAALPAGYKPTYDSYFSIKEQSSTGNKSVYYKVNSTDGLTIMNQSSSSVTVGSAITTSIVYLTN